MNIVDKALIFAAKAHEGQVRKMVGTPYILHPMEVAAIISTMTDDLDTMAAGLLHDTIEDCDVKPEQIAAEFGKRVFALVQSETEDKKDNRPAEATWMERKEDSLLVLKNTKDLQVKILWLSDKLSNMRSFYREHNKRGDEMWNCLHQKDPAMHKWYYKTIAELTSELSDKEAHQEYCRLIDEVFGK